MPFKEPFTLGPFSVDAEGRLTPVRPHMPPAFSVRWRGRTVHARLAQAGGGLGELLIHVNLGRVPSTASDPAARSACFARLRHLPATMPDGWVVRMLPDHQPRLEVNTVVALPITAANLITELTALLLDLEPGLDLVDEAGAGPEVPAQKP